MQNRCITNKPCLFAEIKNRYPILKLTAYIIANCNNGCMKSQQSCLCARTRMLISRIILDNHFEENTELRNGYIYQKIMCTKQRKRVIPTKPNTSGSIPIRLWNAAVIC